MAWDEVTKMKVMETEIEIFLDDLQKDVQKDFLKAMGMENSNEGNYDVVPIAIIPIPKIDDGKIMEDMLNKELTEDQIKAVRKWALPESGDEVLK